MSYSSCITDHSNQDGLNQHELGHALLSGMIHIASESFNIKSENIDVTCLAIKNIEVLSEILPPEHVNPFLMKQFRTLAHSNSLYERRAAFAIVGSAVSGCPEYMEDHIDELLSEIFNAFHDSETIVVHTALVSLTPIAGEFPEKIPEHLITILPFVVESLESSDPTIMMGAYQALSAILPSTPKETISKYIARIMEKSLFLLTANVFIDLKILAIGKHSYNISS